MRLVMLVGLTGLVACQPVPPATVPGVAAPLPASSPSPVAADAVADQRGIEYHFGLPPNALPATLVSVLDGDTITVAIGQNTETIRLLGIDTPEKTGGPRPAECHGDAATTFARELLEEGSTVLLARDAEPRDLYGRLLAYVYRDADGLFVNLAMLEHGAATTLSLEPNTTFADEFAQANAVARQNGRGLWGSCGRPDLVLEGG